VLQRIEGLIVDCCGAKALSARSCLATRPPRHCGNGFTVGQGTNDSIEPRLLRGRPLALSCISGLEAVRAAHVSGHITPSRRRGNVPQLNRARHRFRRAVRADSASIEMLPSRSEAPSKAFEVRDQCVVTPHGTGDTLPCQRSSDNGECSTPSYPTVLRIASVSRCLDTKDASAHS